MGTRRFLHQLLLGIALVASATAAQAVFVCGPPDKRTIQDTPCTVIPPPAPAAPTLPCELKPEQRQRAIRVENQFLTRFPDEDTFRQAQFRDLQVVAVKLRSAGARLEVLRQERKPIDTELEFYKNRPVPPALQTRLDDNEAQFAALADIYRNLEQDVAGIVTRYRCLHDSFAKMWAGAAPGASACEPPTCAPP